MALWAPASSSAWHVGSDSLVVCLFPATGSQRETAVMTDVSRRLGSRWHKQTADRQRRPYHQGGLAVLGTALWETREKKNSNRDKSQLNFSDFTRIQFFGWNNFMISLVKFNNYSHDFNFPASTWRRGRTPSPAGFFFLSFVSPSTMRQMWWLTASVIRSPGSRWRPITYSSQELNSHKRLVWQRRRSGGTVKLGRTPVCMLGSRSH